MIVIGLHEKQFLWVFTKPLTILFAVVPYCCRVPTDWQIMYPTHTSISSDSNSILHCLKFGYVTSILLACHSPFHKKACVPASQSAIVQSFNKQSNQSHISRRFPVWSFTCQASHPSAWWSKCPHRRSRGSAWWHVVGMPWSSWSRRWTLLESSMPRYPQGQCSWSRPDARDNSKAQML